MLQQQLLRTSACWASGPGLRPCARQMPLFAGHALLSQQLLGCVQALLQVCEDPLGHVAIHC